MTLVTVTADLCYGAGHNPDPELKAWRHNIVPKPKDREVFARIRPDTDLDLTEIEAIVRLLELNHPGRKVYVESDGTVVSVKAEGAGSRRISLAFMTAMAEARASKVPDGDTEYYLTMELPRSRMTFTDVDGGIMRYLRLIRPRNAIWLDGGTWEVLGRPRHPVADAKDTPTYSGRYGEDPAPRVHILSDAEYGQLMAAQYDRGFSDGLEAVRAEAVE